MPTKAWKHAEKRAAKALGGTRNSRGADFGKRGGDVTHSLFQIEVKYRRQLPVLMKEGLSQAASYGSKPPLLLMYEHHSPTAFVVMKLSDFTDLFGALTRPEEDTLERTDPL